MNGIKQNMIMEKNSQYSWFKTELTGQDKHIQKLKEN